MCAQFPRDQPTGLECGFGFVVAVADGLGADALVGLRETGRVANIGHVGDLQRVPEFVAEYREWFCFPEDLRRKRAGRRRRTMGADLGLRPAVRGGCHRQLACGSGVDDEAGRADADLVAVDERGHGVDACAVHERAVPAPMPPAAMAERTKRILSPGAPPTRRFGFVLNRGRRHRHRACRLPLLRNALHPRCEELLFSV